MSGDYVERLRGLLSHLDEISRRADRARPGDSRTERQIVADFVRQSMDPAELREDLRAALDELERLRAERELLGPGEVQRRIVTPDGVAHMPSERDLANRNDWLPGVRLEQRIVCGTPWEPADPQRVELEPKLPERPAQLLAAIQRWGGEWSPMRACRLLDTCGYVATRERAHQIMKHLADRGYLEQVRPRAYTYRLKADVPQQPEDGGDPR